MRCEIESVEELRQHLARAHALRGCALQSLDLRRHADLLDGVPVAGALLLGCDLPAGTAADLSARGAVIFPRLPEVPFDAYRAHLYSPDELYVGLAAGYAATPDARAYAWTNSAAASDLDATLARALHDHAITDALAELSLTPERTVGVMGGHAVARGTHDYLEVARLGHALAQRGDHVVTGGGPGAMEAANLGASLPADADLDAVCAELGEVPSFHDSIEAWAGLAFAVRDRWGADQPGLGIPTWFYGHEPPNIFATQVAKFFDNALREDTLLALCRGGVIVTPGAAGTVQEIFQAVTRRYYAHELADASPLVLVGVEHWTRRLPAWPLVTALAEGRLMAQRIFLVDSLAEAVATLDADRPAPAAAASDIRTP